MKGSNKSRWAAVLVVAIVAGAAYWFWQGREAANSGAPTASGARQQGPGGGRPGRFGAALAPVQAATATSEAVPRYLSGLGTVTAANSTPLTDGAAAVILMTESRAKELGITPLGYLRSYAFTAIDVWQDMLLGPAWSTPLALDRAGLTLADLTLIDMHEAFAAQTLANVQLLASERFARDVLGRAHATGEVDQSKFNVLGGSIAYGHPFAATGARMITQTLHELRRRGGGFGLVTACAAGGLGAAMVLEAE